jgi:hypothetical protein
MKAKRPPRLANGCRVHVKSDHFAEECDAVITKAEYDAGWLYRIKVAASQTPEVCRNQEGELGVWNFEVQPLA